MHKHPHGQGCRLGFGGGWPSIHPFLGQAGCHPSIHPFLGGTPPPPNLQRGASQKSAGGGRPQAGPRGPILTSLLVPTPYKTLQKRMILVKMACHGLAPGIPEMYKLRSNISDNPQED